MSLPGWTRTAHSPTRRRPTRGPLPQAWARSERSSAEAPLLSGLTAQSESMSLVGAGWTWKTHCPGDDLQRSSPSPKYAMTATRIDRSTTGARGKQLPWSRPQGVAQSPNRKARYPSTPAIVASVTAAKVRRVAISSFRTFSHRLLVSVRLVLPDDCVR